MQFIINIKKEHLIYLSVFIILVMAIAVYAPNHQQGHPPGQILFSDVNLYFENGNVGIGATSPGVLLHVKHLTSNAFVIAEGTGNSGFLAESTDGQQKWAMYTSGAGKFRIDRQTAGGELTIDTSGRVGIGSISPQGTLHIKRADDASADASNLVDRPVVNLDVTGAGNAFYYLSRDSIPKAYMSLGTDDSLLFGVTSGASYNKLGITPAGNVQVDQDLHVQGKITSDTTKITLCSFDWSAYATGWRTRNWVASDCSNGLPLSGSKSVGNCRNGAGSQCEADCTSTTQGRHYNHPTTGGSTSGSLFCLYIHH